MFYIYELALRSFFLCFSFGLTGFICYSFRKDLFFILLLPSFQTNHPITHLIFTNPVEVFKISIFIVLLFTFLFWLPYLLWNCLDFIRPALYTKEVKSMKKYISLGLLFFLFGNFHYNPKPSTINNDKLCTFDSINTHFWVLNTIFICHKTPKN